MNPPATPEAIAAFEARLGVRLPAAFADFVRTVANGVELDGSPGLYSLDQIERFGVEGDVHAPFSYSTAEGDAITAAITASSSPLADRAVMGLQKPGAPDGCLTIASNGGNDFSVLVITGEEAGFVWRTGELDAPEVRALYEPGGDRARLDFTAWLAVWAPCILGVSLLP